MAQLFSLFSSDQQPADQQDEITEEDTMKQEQFDALMGKFEGIEAKVTDLETKFSKPAAEETPPDEEPKDEPEGDKGAAGVTAEQFSQLMEKMDGFGKKVDGIEIKFNALSKEQGGQEPDPVGGETVDLV
jgi:hypothetical protein